MRGLAREWLRRGARDGHGAIRETSVKKKTTRRARLWIMTLGAILSASIAWALISDSGVYLPPDYNSGFGNPYPPARGTSYIDPVFGERIWRITDALASGYEFITAEYSNGQHFNADESLLRLIGQRSNGYDVLFVNTSAPFSVAHVGNGLASSNPSDFYWHPTDPDLIYHIAYEDFARYSISQGRSTVLHHFGEYGSITGAGETQMSLDGNRIALVGTSRSNWTPQDVFVYDVSTDTKVASMPIPSGFDSVRMTPSGNGVVVQGSGGAQLYNIQGSQLVHVRSVGPGAGHSDIGLGPDGREYLFYVRSTQDNYVYATRLDTGASTMILPIGWQGAIVGMHVSANSTHEDGWVYVVTYADNLPNNDPTRAWQPFASEIVRARFDGSGWERLGHVRGGGYPDPRVGTYWGSTARGSVSHSGRFVVWNANYLRQFTQSGIPADYTDVYLIEVGEGSDPGGSTPPAAPSALQTTGVASDPRVDLAWSDNSDDEDAFELLRRGPGESSYGMHAYLGADTEAHQDHDVVAGQQYCYRVVAHSSAGASPESNTSCVTLDSIPTPPASPTNVLATGMPEPSVDVAWNDNSADETSFQVRRRGPQDTSFWPIQNLAANVTRFEDSAVTPGEQFCYQIVANNQAGSSPPSDTSCATPPVPEPPPPPAEDLPPAAPEGLSAVYMGRRLMNLSWTDASHNEDGFEVHRRFGFGRYQRIARLPSGTITFPDQRVRPGYRYCYRVRAVNAFGSAFSNEVCVLAK